MIPYSTRFSRVIFLRKKFIKDFIEIIYCLNHACTCNVLCMGVAYKPSSILHTVVCSNSQLYVSKQCLFWKSWFTIFNEIIFANSWKLAKLVKLKTRESLVLYSILSLMEPKWPMCRQSIVCHVFDNVSPSTHCNTAVTCGTMLLPRPFSDFLCCACTWTFRVLNTLLAQLINY